MKLFPFDDVVTQAVSKMAAGFTIYQQFNCAGCGVKQTMGEPDKFFTEGICEECGHVTDIQHDGCNYMAMIGGSGIPNR